MNFGFPDVFSGFAAKYGIIFTILGFIINILRSSGRGLVEAGAHRIAVRRVGVRDPARRGIRPRAVLGDAPLDPA